MKNNIKLSLLLCGILLLLLSSCGKSAPAENNASSAASDAASALNTSSPAAESSSAVEAPATAADYAEYAGYQFSGTDPWEGTLTVTIRSITDGKMEWTFVDSFDGHTLFQLQRDTALQDGKAHFDIQGKDAQHSDVSFAYQGVMDLKDGKLTVTFDSGAVTDNSPEGGSSYHIAEALSDSGLSNQVILERNANGPYTTYTVKEGDSIHSIAKEYGLSTLDLCILNQTVIVEAAMTHGYEFDDIAEYAKYLFPGEELLVPVR